MCTDCIHTTTKLMCYTQCNVWPSSHPPSASPITEPSVWAVRTASMPHRPRSPPDRKIVTDNMTTLITLLGKHLKGDPKEEKNLNKLSMSQGIWVKAQFILTTDILRFPSAVGFRWFFLLMKSCLLRIRESCQIPRTKWHNHLHLTLL